MRLTALMDETAQVQEGSTLPSIVRCGGILHAAFASRTQDVPSRHCQESDLRPFDVADSFVCAALQLRVLICQRGCFLQHFLLVLQFHMVPRPKNVFSAAVLRCAICAAASSLLCDCTVLAAFWTVCANGGRPLRCQRLLASVAKSFCHRSAAVLAYFGNPTVLLERIFACMRHRLLKSKHFHDMSKDVKNPSQ